MAKPLVFTSAAAVFSAGLVVASSWAASSRAGAESTASGHPKACGGVAQTSCAADEYCRMKPPLHADQKGVCKPKPQMCNMLFQPVCGADGKTYPNSCHAERAGVNVASKGACPK